MTFAKALMGGTAAILLPMAAAAQDYPGQAITVVVPYSAGGGGDTVARLVSERLGEELGVQLNVVNRPGAGGEIGIAEIAAADPDGYTIGVFGYPDNFVIESTREVAFNSAEDLDFLAQFDSTPMGVFAKPGAAFSTLDELRAHAEQNPGAVIVGDSGSLGLLNALAFGDKLESVLTPVRYAGGGELMNAVLGGHIDLASTSSMSHDPIVDAGGTPLAFASAERMEMFPDVPTMRELGIDQVMEVGRVVVAPSGLPDDVRARLTEALDAISTDEELIARFETAALPYAYLDSDAVSAKVEETNAALAEVIEANRDQF
ncbi:tripartite tricarboxylate transporter substrate binding protein [Paracoccus liaowanqingii]|uniref:Tripartite tricarboxylate transporter substrate binding protein n=1 Tax=Paracoccus liaowanqingii TaxID=2560053 RepID=A0A4Z1CR98_9RHOB|nr:tripartite tricarboxylate transporter substrate binding protein [Paracoccus liaowanqingii]QDA36293.1 tripartite tricarboxylate transporter substrate binding protein [Paracoccus liaowanqingii]TGN67743.1 tripartite tricarboxylate transporter substrate binding protein [Paracoccus liaowanqingii]